MMTGRFAPSATGDAHPGTLLAALLAWLDARSRGARFVLRIEDLDPQRCSPEWTQGLIEACRWLGIDWDELEIQSRHADRHAAALDRLAALGALYPCDLSRSQLAALGRRAPDGSWTCDNRNRGRPLPPGGWRACEVPLRVALPDDAYDAAKAFGDPLVRRRDGAIAYQLAVVIDDAAQGVDRVVRGRDIEPSTVLQNALQRLLGLPLPSYRHHLLLLEPSGSKLAKLHRSVGLHGLVAAGWDATRLCGILANAAGLRPDPEPISARSLLDGFAWERVATADRTLAWNGAVLSLC